MKIYHTETQADFDALMVELEAVGCEWFSGRKPTEATTYWKLNSIETCVKIDKKVIAYNEKGYYAMRYPSIPIIKYKEKADEKMKFTKENVYKMVARYRLDFDYLIDDLKSDIFDLEYTPEKVGVPKYIAEYLIKAQDEITLMRVFEIANAENELKKWKKEYDWIRKNSEKFAKAWVDGYTIEPEQLYYIPLPHLETTLGIQQVLSKRKNDTNYFASRPASALQQRYTKEELEQVPEIYKPFAVPVGDKHENNE